MPKRSIQSEDKYVVRLPDGMRDRLKEAAETQNRSMNAEIVDRLEWSFDSWPRIRLPQDVKARAWLYTSEERQFFEEDVSQYATETAKKMFPDTNLYMFWLMEALENLTNRVSIKYKKEIQDKTNDFIESILERMKPSEAEEARKMYEQYLDSLNRSVSTILSEDELREQERLWKIYR